LKKPCRYSRHSSRAPRPSASLRLLSNYFSLSPIAALILSPFSSLSPFYKTFIAFIVCVISRNIIFWAPTVGFGHRRSCFSATTFRLCLKVDWSNL
jgi:hypothetical protein